jgi:hypothetical protein
MMNTAQCSCGALTAVVRADPTAVVACHCKACQRRTGSPIGVAAYFPKEAVELRGEARKFSRPTDSGNALTNYFCAVCGATVYWDSARHPDAVGIAVGAFADPGFPAPQRSVWEQSKHPWVALPPDIQHFEKGRTSTPAAHLATMQPPKRS